MTSHCFLSYVFSLQVYLSFMGRIRSTNSAHWVQTESGKNIQNVGGYEQGPNDCLIDENCVRSLRIIFFPVLI